MLCIIMLNVTHKTFMLCVIRLDVVMLSVMAKSLLKGTNTLAYFPPL
jgi:hypothetical protein